MRCTSRSFLLINRLVDPFSLPDARLQRMAKSRNVAAVDDFEVIIRPKVEQGDGGPNASERDGNAESWEKA